MAAKTPAAKFDACGTTDVVDLAAMARDATYADARRALEICNACRYCEGFCAVFPAMTLRREFSDGDINYLANLCHNCRGCFYSCQYAPPHEFGINVPKTFSDVRVESYEAYAWPQGLARLFRRNGTVLSLATGLGTALALGIVLYLVDPAALYAADDSPGAFYRVVPWAVIVALSGAALGFAIIALFVGGIRFWRDSGGGSVPAAGPAAEAARDILTLRNLGGGGGGCNDLSERYSNQRRIFHHFMFYGFLLCFAATSVATLYDHVLGLIAPYHFFSIPVQLGFWGGIGLVIGPVGLLWLKIVGDREPASQRVMGGDFALLALLLLISVTGLALLGLRDTAAMGILLAVHLGMVLSFFLFLPYSKMVHGLYRSLALLRSAIERRQ